MKRLMGLFHVVRRQTGRDRLDTLALDRQKQTRAIVLQRQAAVGVPCGFGQALNLCRKANLLWAWRREA